MKTLWARAHMPMLKQIRARYALDKPFDGLTIGVCCHLEAKTAVLCETLQAGGARVVACGSNPLSTQTAVTKTLTEGGIRVFGSYGDSAQDYRHSLEAVLNCNPDLILDDGGDLTALAHELDVQSIRGGTEQTTTGVTRLRQLDLKFPVVAVNDSRMKYLFDNRYGTGQSVWTALMSLTNQIVTGKIAVVAGYGWCGRGIALRGKALGAEVIVTEVDPIKALEARMDGFRVLPMSEAAYLGDFFITATGNRDVITAAHFAVMKDGAVLCNAGHFDVEVDVAWLGANADSRFPTRQNVTTYCLGGTKLHLLCEGRLVNLAGGDGHPCEIMDMSFAAQCAAMEFLLESDLVPGVHRLPAETDEALAWKKLMLEGIEIDELTQTQKMYLGLP